MFSIVEEKSTTDVSPKTTMQSTSPTPKETGKTTTEKSSTSTPKPTPKAATSTKRKITGCYYHLKTNFIIEIYFTC